MISGVTAGGGTGLSTLVTAGTRDDGSGLPALATLFALAKAATSAEEDTPAAAPALALAFAFLAGCAPTGAALAFAFFFPAGAATGAASSTAVGASAAAAATAAAAPEAAAAATATGAAPNPCPSAAALNASMTCACSSGVRWPKPSILSGPPSVSSTLAACLALTQPSFLHLYEALPPTLSKDPNRTSPSAIFSLLTVQVERPDFANSKR